MEAEYEEAIQEALGENAHLRIPLADIETAIGGANQAEAMKLHQVSLRSGTLMSVLMDERSAARKNTTP